ncbi:TIGR03915 family putative DNA repair protein [Gilvimarinus sp. DA14]|uniref:TIGR03915 family putative DNA repair protein n=1 Tax=Gilvimarinus sp. DA14 TaxID=2956798 RepID=UPI0020B84448|nr:TIGR03915 family putative DNA repair protein [Gilvimarinus sp. DA14]UTF59010.1 TIGR03915 family putative DNA repair protein [Gilvimarinus sp. DA14]
MYYFNVNHFREWRRCARSLLQARISPDEIEWGSGNQHSLFEPMADSLDEIDSLVPAGRKPAITMPKAFVELAETAACYRDSKKWQVLYRLAWKLQNHSRHIIHDLTDSDVIVARDMAKSVSRDMHKMKAFVRFNDLEFSCLPSLINAESVEFLKRNISGDGSSGESCFVAWFEPDHLIVEKLSPFFAKRFTGMHWCILTPDQCVFWNQAELRLAPGCEKPAGLADPMHGMWKTYYKSIYNPARLKEQAMQSEMPKKYWKNLPEAELLPELIEQSSARTQKMLENERTPADRLSRKSSALRNAQFEIQRTLEKKRQEVSSAPPKN